MAQLMLINPRRRSAGRKKTRTAAQKRATAKLVALNKSRKRRSNPIAANPKRRTYRHAAASSAPRRSRRRSNPISLRNPVAMLMPALIGAGGALAVNAVVNYIPLPAMLTQGRMRYVTKFGIAVLLGTVGRKFLGSKAEKMAEGSMIVTMTDALKDVVGGATGLQLGENDDGIAYYSPAQIAEYTDQMSMYMNGAESVETSPDGYNYS